MINSLLAIFVFFCFLQMADAYTTYVILSKGGRELNPVMRVIMDRMGVLPGLLICKILLCVAVWFYIMDKYILFICNVVYIGVVINNVLQMRKQG